MTVIKSLYQNKSDEPEEVGKTFGGYKHRVHRSRKNKLKYAGYRRGMRIMASQKKLKFNKIKVLRDL